MQQEMKPLRQPQLKIGKSGIKILVCYYTSTCWDEAIEAAEKCFDIENDPTVTVIAKPYHNPQMAIPFGTNTGID